jgi:hypothetical protein
MDQRGYAWLVIGSAFAALIFTAWMSAIQKDVPRGLGLRLELASSRHEARSLLEGAPLEALNCSIGVDYGFLISYSLLNAALFLFLRGLSSAGSWLRHPAFIVAGLVLAVLMLVGDAVENQQIQACIHAFPGTYSGAFLLAFFARMKWLSLGVASLLLGAAFLSLPWGANGWLSWIVLAAYVAAAFFSFQGVLASEPESGWKPLFYSILAFGPAWILSAVRAGLTLRS